MRQKIELSAWGEYPIDSHLDSIVESIGNHGVVAIDATPGAGKTTRLPGALIQTTGSRILVIEPRRLAAKNTAQFVEEIVPDAWKSKVGYQIRGEKKNISNSRVNFVTEGIFLAYLKEDPLLDFYDIFIIDEFHERNLTSDFALAYLIKLQKKRPNLKIIIMSATLDKAPLKKHIPQLYCIEIPGKVFPLTIEYHGNEQSRNLFDIELMVRTIQYACKDPRAEKNILIFLPGKGEINALRSQLNHRLQDWDIHQLSSQTSKQELIPIFKPTKKRKIILSTNVAETSVTIDGVDCVIDSGLARVAAFAPWSSTNSLELKKITKDSAIQRAGRAARLKEGLVLRCYTHSDYGLRQDFLAPEIQRVDLSDFSLMLKALNLRPEDLPLPSAPNQKNLEIADENLSCLGLIDQNHHLTEQGREILKIPTTPRLAKLILLCRQLGFGVDGAICAAILNQGSLVKRSYLSQGLELEDEDNDLYFNLKLFWAKQLGSEDLIDYPLNIISSDIFYSIKREVQSLLKPEEGLSDRDLSLIQKRDLNQCLIQSFPDRVAFKIKSQKNKMANQYKMTMGRGGQIEKTSGLTSDLPKTLLALRSIENPKLKGFRSIQISMACKIDQGLLEKFNSHMIRREYTKTHNKKKNRFQLLETVYYGQITLAENELGLTQEQTSLAELLKQIWPTGINNPLVLERYHRRIEWLNSLGITHHCPVYRDDMFDLLIELICENKKELAELKSIDLNEIVDSNLSELDRYTMTKFTPESIEIAGRHYPLTYPENEDPILTIPLYQLYGQKRHPSIGEGKIALVLEILGPNGQMVQKTNDLIQFWEGSYPQLIKELKSRYPKHHYPDTPISAPPIALKRHLKVK